MAQNPPRFCQTCGAPIQPNQKFCTNCGTTFADDAYKPTILAGNPSSPSYPGIGPQGQGTPPPQPNAGGPQGEISPTVIASLPTTPYGVGGPNAAPPPPPTTFHNPPNLPPTNTPPYREGNYQSPGFNPPPATAAPPTAFAPVPAYAQKPKRRNSGCIIASIIFLVIVIGGIVGVVFLVQHFAQDNGNNTTANQNNSQSNNNDSGNNNVNNLPTTTQELNLAFVYSSVNITLQSAQEGSGSNFKDDDYSTNSSVTVRLNLQENNSSSYNSSYNMTDSFHLLLSDGNSIQVANEKNGSGPNSQINRTNWLDFSLDKQVTLSDIVLHVGNAKENGYDIPLKKDADITKYQDKTASPGSTVNYDNLNWTLKTTTLSYSFAGVQAQTGNRYLVVILDINNPSSSNFSAYYGDYIRLKAGSNSLSPDGSSDFPTSVPASGTASGTLSFIVPQDVTSFTLVFLAQPSSQISQASQDFTVQ